MSKLPKEIETEKLVDWWVKMMVHLEKEEKKMVRQKMKKLLKLLANDKEK